jgi:demethylmenaquinone methyltransferase/2-methoxy-6-polyprenyl-1,4-benzoquinol methylase
MPADHPWQSGMSRSKTELVERFFSDTGSTYDFVVELCTFGFDRLWKRRILRKIPDRPSRIMDLACGTGILTFRIAQEFPDCHVIGVELRDEYLDIARLKAQAMDILNVEFILSRAEDVVLAEPLDCITGSYLAKYADLLVLIRNTKKMLRDGGVLVMHDFTLPPHRVSSWLWKRYFRLMQTAGAWKYPQWQTIFFELPDLIQKTQWLTELVGLLGDHSFSGVTIEPLTFGTSAIVSARK